MVLLVLGGSLVVAAFYFFTSFELSFLKPPKARFAYIYIYMFFSYTINIKFPLIVAIDRIQKL